MIKFQLSRFIILLSPNQNIFVTKQKPFCNKNPYKKFKLSTMVMLIENQGNQRCALDGSTIEPFTQKTFAELLANSHSQQLDYYLARVVCCDEQSGGGEKKLKSFYCYDGKQICKYIFEMQISEEGKKIQIKNFRDPINQKKIQELYFFRLRHDSDTPLKAEFAGCYTDFLENQNFRTQIFANENALDALSVNFLTSKGTKNNYGFKSQMVSVLLTILFIIAIVTGIIIFLEKKQILVDKNDGEVNKSDVDFKKSKE